MGMNFEQAAAGSADRFFATFGVPVTVRRGENALTLTAIASWRQYAGETEAGTIVQAKVRDYRFRAADLVLGGVAFLPAAGDRIEEGALRCEVSPVFGGDCWEWNDDRELTAHAVVLGGQT